MIPYIVAYAIVSLSGLVLGRAWQHRTGNESDTDYTWSVVAWVALWPVVLFVTAAVLLWISFDRALRWIVVPRPVIEPEKVEDPKAGYRDPGLK